MSITKLLAGLFLVGAAAMVAAPAVEAFPPATIPTTSSPGLLAGNGSASTAIFAFSDAADTSELSLTGFGGNPIFNNSTNNDGDTVALGILVGPQQFSLNNMTQSNIFFANIADGDGNFHAFYTADFADFAVGALPGAVQTAIDALPMGSSVIFIGWEDKTVDQGSDFDYNDLIFAFSNLTPVSDVPEPSTWLLFATGLAGVVSYGWRKRRAA